MAVDLPVAEFIAHIGHDGSEIVLPGEPDPICRAGFHPQEAVEVAWEAGFTSTPFEFAPKAINRLGDQPRRVFTKTNVIWLLGATGVLECVTRYGTGHAVCFDDEHILDPDGHEYPFADLGVHSLRPLRLWRIERRWR
jgi:hypothetical protein